MKDGYFFNDTATTEIYTRSLHDALPIFVDLARRVGLGDVVRHVLAGLARQRVQVALLGAGRGLVAGHPVRRDRKSTRLNSSHANISYAVFCLKKNTFKMLAKANECETTD